MDMCAIPDHLRMDVLRIISRCTRPPWDATAEPTTAAARTAARTAEWTHVRAKLNKLGLNQKQADDLRVFTCLPPRIDDALRKVETVRSSCCVGLRVRAKASLCVLAISLCVSTTSLCVCVCLCVCVYVRL